MFHFPRFASCLRKIIKISLYGVSSFGHLRIEGCLAPPRSVSPPRCVLHRLSKPRHSPYALICFLLSRERNLRTAIICCLFYYLFPQAFIQSKAAGFVHLSKPQKDPHEVVLMMGCFCQKTPAPVIDLKIKKSRSSRVLPATEKSPANAAISPDSWSTYRWGQYIGALSISQ